MLSIIDSKVVLLIYAFVTTLALSLLVKLFSKSSISNIPGPPASSWVLGNQAQIEKAPAAENDFKWFRQFGHTWRTKGGFSEDILMTADPKALQYIFQTSSYSFQRVPFLRERVKLLTGPGILWAEGNDHKRHRKVMLPAFALPETKALNPIFRSKAVKMVESLEELLSKQSVASATQNVHAWLARATLDAIGEAAFDYKFGALDEDENPLSKNFQGLMLKSRAFPSWMKSAVSNALVFLPPVVGRVAQYIPTSGNQRVAQNLEVSTRTAEKLLSEKEIAIGTEAERKDVMSLLVKSNSSENEKARLSKEEMTAQMSTIMFAGHETTANSLSWTLWELAKSPSIQDKLREEIRHWIQVAQDRGEDHIPVSDYDKMQYTVGVMKETLRYHSIVNDLARSAGRDLVVPLANPIRTLDGKLIHEIPLKKGTRIVASIAQYNRLPELWGPDFDVYKPERWLDQLDAKIKFGVYGNLGSFGAGIHACIGWRFAVYEMQSFLIEMISHFKFELPDKAPRIRRTYAGVMVPVVEGDRDETSMPLKISPVV